MFSSLYPFLHKICSWWAKPHFASGRCSQAQAGSREGGEPMPSRAAELGTDAAPKPALGALRGCRQQPAGISQDRAKAQARERVFMERALEIIELKPEIRSVLWKTFLLSII